MVSKRKSAANRRNAQLSTGPKDTTNTRYNALKHGISSEQAVVPTVDGNDAAKLYDERRNGLWQDLSPQGPLESVLVDRIALSMQQYKRMLAYENAVIQRQAESSFQGLIVRVKACQAIIDRVEALLPELDRPEELVETADLKYMLAFLQERWGVSGEETLGEPVRTEIEGDFNICFYSLEQRREFIEFACEQCHLSEDELRAQFKEYLGQQIHRTKEELERNNQQLERSRGLASLPDDAELNRILKYESRTDRGLYKSLHELQRLQAGRQGEHPSLPAALDVTVDVDTSTPDGTGLDVDFPQESVAAEVGSMPDEGCIAGERGAAEIRQLSEPLSASQSTDTASLESGASSRENGLERETGTGGYEPEVRQQSERILVKFKSAKRTGTPLRDFLSDAEIARLVALRKVGESCDGDSGERLPAAKPHDGTIRQNEANESGDASAGTSFKGIRVVLDR